MDYCFATPDDIPLLSAMNRQLVEDEGHRNRSRSEAWFEERMRGFLNGDYTAVLFQVEGETVAYALYRDHPEHEDTIYLRQIWVHRERRRQGIGREAMHILQQEVWPPDKRLTVEVLANNHAARAFYRAVGYREYSVELEIAASDRARS